MYSAYLYQEIKNNFYIQYFQTEYEELAPYVFTIIGSLIVGFFLHLLLRYYQQKKDFVWNRQLLSFKKLSIAQKDILNRYSFFLDLNIKNRKEFEHRVSQFIRDKKFRHRYNKLISDEQKVLISATACQLTFGRRSYLFPMLDTILLFDEAFKSPTNENEHKGEYNPSAKVLALSWKDFKEGMDISNDNLHLGLHEFTHVLHFESERLNNVDGLRYQKYHHLILKALMQPQIRQKIDSTKFFRAYAFTNQYEFMAVLTEYFFESTAEFKQKFPHMFHFMKQALLYQDKWLKLD